MADDEQNFLDGTQPFDPTTTLDSSSALGNETQPFLAAEQSAEMALMADVPETQPFVPENDTLMEKEAESLGGFPDQTQPFEATGDDDDSRDLNSDAFLGPTQPFDAAEAEPSDSMLEADRIIDDQLNRMATSPTADSNDFLGALPDDTQAFDTNDAPASPTADDAPDSPAPDDAPASPVADDAPSSPTALEEPASPEPEEPSKSPTNDAPKSPTSPNAETSRARMSESPDFETGEGSTPPPRPLSSDSDDSDSGKKKSPEKRRVVDSDDDSEGELPAAAPRPEPDSGDSDVPAPAEKDETEQAIADIFGEGEDKSDDERSDGGKVERAAGEEGEARAGSGGEEAPGEDGDGLGLARGGRGDFEWDFDAMLRRKKSENRKRKRARRKDGSIDLQSDADEQIKELVASMKEAADDDRRSNKTSVPAVKKRKMLPLVVDLLRKADYLEALVDFGIITAIAEWLAPLPDKSLPSLEIRTQLLSCLQQYTRLDQSILRTSGIGKSVMILFKHPKEVKTNRQAAGKLISEWSRPIFELDTDYRNLSKKDREERDYQMMPASKKQRLSRDGEGAERRPSADEAPGGSSRPGEKGWVGRARVPRPSTRDYVVRPKPAIEAQFKKESKIKSGLTKKLQEYKNRQKSSGGKDHAVPVSIEGRKMQI